MNKNKIAELFQKAEAHQKTHDCSAHPYQSGLELTKIIEESQPKRILEIGTGMGYTAAIMALCAPAAHVWTIEKDPEHVKAAESFFKYTAVENRINIIADSAENVLPVIKETFDCIFFDGYNIHYEFLPQYHRLLNSGGVLIVANNHLKSKTSDQFFAELNDRRHWKISQTFADTTVAYKI